MPPSEISDLLDEMPPKVRHLCEADVLKLAQQLPGEEFIMFTRCGFPFGTMVVTPTRLIVDLQDGGVEVTEFADVWSFELLEGGKKALGGYSETFLISTMKNGTRFSKRTLDGGLWGIQTGRAILEAHEQYALSTHAGGSGPAPDRRVASYGTRGTVASPRGDATAVGDTEVEDADSDEGLRTDIADALEEAPSDIRNEILTIAVDAVNCLNAYLSADEGVELMTSVAPDATERLTRNGVLALTHRRVIYVGPGPQALAWPLKAITDLDESPGRLTITAGVNVPVKTFLFPGGDWGSAFCNRVRWAMTEAVIADE
jgi:hypothetical protein